MANSGAITKNNQNLPPDWIVGWSATRKMEYYFNMSTGKSYWENDIHFGENGKITISLNARQHNDVYLNADNDDHLNDEMIAKIRKGKPQPTVQHNNAQSMNILKRKHEEKVSQPSCSKQNSDVPCKIKKTSPKYQVNILTEGQSKKSSPTNYPQTHSKIGSTKTPIQDKFDKKREDLLNKQQQNNSGLLLSSPKEDHSPNILLQDNYKRTVNGNCKRKEEPKMGPQNLLHKTPIQDSYNKKKILLFKKQQEKNGQQRNSIESDMPTKKPSTFAEPLRHSLDSKTSTRKRITFAEPERAESENSLDSELPIKNRLMLDGLQRNSIESDMPTKKPSTFAEPLRHSLDSKTSTRKRITFAEPQRAESENSLDSELPIKNRLMLAEPQRVKSENSPDSEPPINKRLMLDRRPSHTLPSTSSGALFDEQQIFDLRTKLQQRKPVATHHNPQPDDSNEMEWETSYQSEPISHEVVNNELLPTQEKHSHYSNIFIVCDTSALIKGCDFVENLIGKGSYLGLPLTIVIPCIVLDELDKLKDRDGVGHKARCMNRVIQKSHSSKYLHLQDGDKKREAVGSLELKVNDDLVLNCCLQMREKCGENDLAILMTDDINLSNKATSFKLQSYSWNSFKRWARGFREYKYPSVSPHTSKQVSPAKMNIDGNSEVNLEKTDFSTSHSTSEDKKMFLNGTVDNNNQLEENVETDLFSNSSVNIHLQSVTQSHLEEVQFLLQAFLHNVLEEAYEKEYGHLKQHATNIKPSWTVLDYISEVQNRWFLLTSSLHSPQVHQMLQGLLSILKKHNKGKEELKVADVDNVFKLCTSLVKTIAKHFTKRAYEFSKKLKALECDWKEACINLSPTSIIENVIEDVQPVDVALQNIHQRSYSDYEYLKNQLDSNKRDKNIEKLVAELYGRISNMEYTLNKIIQETPGKLTADNMEIRLLHNTITLFVDVKGNPIGFEIDLENVVELFQDKAYRNNVKQQIEKFQCLKTLIEYLINTLE